MNLPATLITQCLQHDFVAPLGRFDPLPNLLHVGAEEARRLMGENPAQGPIAQLMAWAYAEDDTRLALLHIRDWHDPDDPGEQQHLSQFGPHCLRDTPGAAFAFPVPAENSKQVPLIDSLTLNDFIGTRLATALETRADALGRIGLVGVWTEAKITFLAYELRSRYPDAEIAVCSALTASSSRARHVQALEQLRRLLGVRVFESTGEFIEFLGGQALAPRLSGPGNAPRIDTGADTPLAPEDRALIAYLFRDCGHVQARPLGGGYSGNLIFACNSEDLEHRAQTPHVLKIGPRGPIAQERSAFEQIEAVLGNSAPRIVDFADHGPRGAIKYRYASMGGGAVTFQKLYQNGLDAEAVQNVLDTVFGEQLGRLYASAERQSGDLLDYYGFCSARPPRVRPAVEAILGRAATGPTLELPGGLQLPDLCRFYEQTLATLPRHPGRSWWFAWVHGDLNGANILLDGHRNVWLIDFFHTHRGHVLKDLIKLENDLLYIWTPCQDEAGLLAAARFTDRLLAVDDLAAPLPDATAAGIDDPVLVRAWNSVRRLRQHYPALLHADRDPLQLLIGQLRYASHTLSFDECNLWQKRWALYTATRCAERITALLTRPARLRIDWLAPHAPGLGLTLLPGRRDYARELSDDLAVLQEAGVTHVLSLLTDNELARHGAAQLPAALREAGFLHAQIPIHDQQPANRPQWADIRAFLDGAFASGGRVVLHCVGGLGRSGMIAAAWLVERAGLSPAAALAEVRRVRSPRAVETPEQEAFVCACGCRTD